MDPKQSPHPQTKLYNIAQAQNGYFIPQQAIACGYSRKNFSYHLKKNHWERPLRGVYRLTNFPLSEDDQYALWSLWIGEEQGVPVGVYSHLTALSYYDLSEVIPQKLHITVPDAYKTTRTIPKILVMHRGNIAENDINWIGAYSMTTPKKTLLDVANENMMELNHLATTVVSALKKGYINEDFVYENAPFNKILPIIAKIKY